MSNFARIMPQQALAEQKELLTGKLHQLENSISQSTGSTIVDTTNNDERARLEDFLIYPTYPNIQISATAKESVSSILSPLLFPEEEAEVSHQEQQSKESGNGRTDASCDWESVNDAEISKIRDTCMRLKGVVKNLPAACRDSSSRNSAIKYEKYAVWLHSATRSCLLDPSTNAKAELRALGFIYGKDMYASQSEQDGWKDRDSAKTPAQRRAQTRVSSRSFLANFSDSWSSSLPNGQTSQSVSVIQAKRALQSMMASSAGTSTTPATLSGIEPSVKKAIRLAMQGPRLQGSDDDRDIGKAVSRRGQLLTHIHQLLGACMFHTTKKSGAQLQSAADQKGIVSNSVSMPPPQNVSPRLGSMPPPQNVSPRLGSVRSMPPPLPPMPSLSTSMAPPAKRPRQHIE